MLRELNIQLLDGSRQTLRLTGQRVCLGRAADNDLAYPDDPVLSRRHMVVDFDGSDYFVEDLRSKNGTTLNGVKLEERRKLQLGDRVVAGRATLVYDDAAAAEHTVVFVPEDDTIQGTVSTDLKQALGPDGAGLQAALGSPVFGGMSRMQALLDAGRELDGHRPLPELFETILELAVSSVGARRGVVMTLENGELTPRTARGDNFRMSSSVRDQVMRERRSLLIGDTSTDDALRGSMTILQQGVKSLIAVPLQTADAVIGLLYVDSPDLFRPFTADDLTLLTVMANIAAVRIESSLLAEERKANEKMAEDLRRAAEIQRTLLPHVAPLVHGLDIHGYSMPCRSVGGDYYDFIRMPGGKLGVIVGDVAGKGMPAALMMSSLQARVQMLAEEGGGVAALVSRLNRGVAANCPGNRFITFFMAIVTPETGNLEYCNAGHNPPWLVRAAGNVEALETGGPVLGILPQAPFLAGSATLEPGDALLLFSDGAPEARSADDEEFGDDRLLQELQTRAGSGAREIVQGMTEALERFMGTAAAVDDVTLVAVKRAV